MFPQPSCRVRRSYVNQEAAARSSFEQHGIFAVSELICSQDDDHHSHKSPREIEREPGISQIFERDVIVKARHCNRTELLRTRQETRSTFFFGRMSPSSNQTCGPQIALSSTGFRSGLFGIHMSGSMKVTFSRRRKLIVFLAVCEGAPSCCSV